MCALVALAPTLASGQPAGKGAGKPAPSKPPAPAPAPDDDAGPKGKPAGKAKVFDFTGLDISGRLRTPQLLYFLERASEELERASLKRRSFIPELVRSIDEESL
ncbi:MAG: hypothetical protein R2939_13285 [Kofleriaceae bacterium]